METCSQAVTNTHSIQKNNALVTEGSETIPAFKKRPLYGSTVLIYLGIGSASRPNVLP